MYYYSPFPILSTDNNKVNNKYSTQKKSGFCDGPTCSPVLREDCPYMACPQPRFQTKTWSMRPCSGLRKGWGLLGVFFWGGGVQKWPKWGKTAQNGPKRSCPATGLPQTGSGTLCGLLGAHEAWSGLCMTLLHKLCCAFVSVWGALGCTLGTTAAMVILIARFLGAAPWFRTGPNTCLAPRSGPVFARLAPLEAQRWSCEAIKAQNGPFWLKNCPECFPKKPFGKVNGAYVGHFGPILIRPAPF